MKPLYVIFLMGAAAIGGGLIVRYNDHPAAIATSRPVPPAVVAPPIAPSNNTPAAALPVEQPAETSATPPAPETPVEPKKSVKPSPLSEPVHVGAVRRAYTTPSYPTYSRVPAEAPAIVQLQRATSVPVAPVTPRQSAPPPVATAEVPQPLSVPDPQPAPAQAPLVAESDAPEPNRVTLQPGLLIAIRLTDALSSERNSQGDVFSGTLEKPLIVDGFVIAERGARVRGEVVEARRAGRVQGQAELAIRLKEVATSDGQRIHILSQTWHKQASSSAGMDAAKVGGGAALGAIIGAIAGGGKGAAIGAGVGGAAGVGDVMLTRGGPAEIRPETSITFRLDQPVEITERR